MLFECCVPTAVLWGHGSAVGTRQCRGDTAVPCPYLPGICCILTQKPGFWSRLCPGLASILGNRECFAYNYSDVASNQKRAIALWE